MGNNKVHILEKFFQDISKLSEAIEEVKVLEDSFKREEKENEIKVGECFEASRAVIERLKDRIGEIHGYFIPEEIREENGPVDGPDKDQQEEQPIGETTRVLETNETEPFNSDATLIENDLPDPVKPKPFLKCVDINTLKLTGKANDSVLVISDSEPDESETAPVPHNTIDNNGLTVKIGSEICIYKLPKKTTEENSLPTFSLNTANSRDKFDPIKKPGKTVKSGKSVEDRLAVKKSGKSNEDHLAAKNLGKSTEKSKTIKDPLAVTEITNSENSSSDMESLSHNNVKRGPKKKREQEPPVSSLADKKFSCKTYIRLIRYPCEKLQEMYLKASEVDEINKLTDLSTLKKRYRRTSSTRTSSSSSDEKTKRPSKRTKKDSNSENDLELDSPSSPTVIPMETVPDTELKDHIAEILNEDINLDISEMDSIQEEVGEKSKEKKSSDKTKLSDEDKQSNKDGSDNEDSDKDSSNSKTKKSSDEKKLSDNDKQSNKDGSDNEDSDKDSSNSRTKKSSEEKKLSDDDKQSNKDGSDNEDSDKGSSKSKTKDNAKSDSDTISKSKPPTDKLLKKSILKSDTDDDEDDFLKRKIKVKSKSKRTQRLAKRIKSVMDSDSSSTDTKKKTKKSDSSSFSSKESSESSSSESLASVPPKTDKPKRGRIKRVQDSSDEDKSTRKNIRKVIENESLEETTKQAEKEEKERKARILERQKKYNSIFENDEPTDSNVDKVVLDFDEESKTELLSVHTDIVSKLKPHQAKGVQFMWDACFESLKRTKETDGSGCILAHCMGLGKTLQVIAFVHTLMMNAKETGINKVLVVCPMGTVLNWIDEFNKWLADMDTPEIELFQLAVNKQISYREYLVKEWSKDGGVLVIGYDMFRNLANQKNKRLSKKMRDSFYKSLVDPGPDLIVCDEGHLLKNEKTHLSVAISQVKTRRRIILTGTPMQNNMKEYYCMVQFVKPNLLGTYKEYLNRFVNPITNGQYTDSTAHDISIMKKRSHVLHKMLDGIVQRKDYGVLAPFLPPKYEYVLFTKLSEVQIQLYRFYLENLSRRPTDSKLRRTAYLFTDFQEFQRICTHPRVLLNKTIDDEKKALLQTDDEDESGSISTRSSSDESSAKSTSSDSSKKSNTANKNQNKGPTQRITRTAKAALGLDTIDLDVEEEAKETSDELAWWKKIINGEELENIAIGGKIYLLFVILQQCELIGDKILIFSQSLYSLNIIEYFLEKIHRATQDNDSESVAGFSGSWVPDLDYFRIDGSSSCDNRASWCKSFNSPKNHRARLFLISTRAGGLGINLTGANRVIIFDVSWNPSHDMQSIYRVYRFGQSKPCYIYRFVTWGTMEMKLYERQVTKTAISKRIIDEQQIDRHYNQNDLAELYNFDPEPAEASTPLLPKDVLLAELLQAQKDRIYKYHEHQSLLENKEEEELDEAERKAAWEEFENEKNKPAFNINQSYMGAGFIKSLPMASISTALISILHKDNPQWTREQVLAVLPTVLAQLQEQVDKGDNTLFNRIVREVKQLQDEQRQKLQQYYIQQQYQILQQRLLHQQTMGQAQSLGSRLVKNMFSATAPTKRNDKKRATFNANEIVDLND